ncbi:hypothetical protein BH09BAC5_BH09BAC5_01390 [soil metagenome]
MKILCALGLYFLHISVIAQNPYWQWAKNTTDGIDNEVSTTIATDSIGNSYITGSFSSPSVTFGSITLTNDSSIADIFVVKYDSSGNVVWAKTNGGISVSVGVDISIDEQGNSYVLGLFTSPTARFGTNTLTNTNNSSRDIFIAKYDPLGNVVWAKSFGGISYEIGVSISLDGRGNLFIVGNFSSPEIIFGLDTLVNTDSSGNSEDIFIARLDTSGSMQWAKKVGGLGEQNCASINADIFGNAFITGRFWRASMNLENIVFTNADTTGNTSDIFIAKYDSIGNLRWAKSAGGKLAEFCGGGQSDATGNFYFTGLCNDTITFGSVLLINSDSSGISTFLAKCDSSGNFIWARAAGGNSNNYGENICVDAKGNSYVSGYFSGSSVTFQNDTLFNINGEDIFVVKYDSTGNVIWGKSGGGSSNNASSSSGIDIDSYGNPYLTGNYELPSIVFDNDTLINSYNSLLDFFIAKLCAPTPTPTISQSGQVLVSSSAIGNQWYLDSVLIPGATGQLDSITSNGAYTVIVNSGCSSAQSSEYVISNNVPLIVNLSSLEIFPDPSEGIFTLRQTELKADLKIYSSLGKLVYYTNLSAGKSQIDLSSEPGGIYYLSVQSENNCQVKKIMIIK